MSKHTPGPGENYEHDLPCTNPGHAGQTYAQCGHTPGPWRACSGMVETVVPDKNGQHVCGIPIAHMDRNPGNGTMPVERDQNARLIALAPEMVALLRALLTADPGSPADADFRDVARALLARLDG